MGSGRRFVFVLSHMRSYSTLLCHILNAHEEIDGYAELHLPYRNADDLRVLEQRMATTLAHPPRGRYVLDKVLHDDYEMADGVLGRDDVYLLFTLRPPERTIPSIMTLGLRTVPPDWKADAHRAGAYYCRRVERLAGLAERHPERALFFSSDDVVADTETVLDAIASHLHLSAPLVASYDTHPYTGQDGYGDWSPYITQGGVVAQREDYHDVPVPQDVLRAARRAFTDARARIAMACHGRAGDARTWR